MVFAGVLLLGMAPMAGLLWHTAQSGREAHAAEAQTRLLQAARYGARMQTQAVEDVGNLLKLVAEQRADWAEVPAQCHGRAIQFTQMQSYIAGFAVLRQSGQVVCSQAGPGRGVSLADRQYFRMALRSREVVVGAPAISRITGQPTVPVALRLPLVDTTDPDPPMVLAALIDLSELTFAMSTVLNLEGAGHAGHVAVLDTNGARLVRHPPAPDGAPQPPGPIRNAVLAALEGMLTLPDGNDDLRLVGFAHAGDAGTIYVVSMLTSAVTAPADAQFRAVLALAGLAALGGLAMAFWVAHVRVLGPMALLTRVAESVRQGQPPDLPPHRLPAEFEVLRQAMAGMLHTVERREQSLHQANRDLAHLAERDALTGIANRRAFDEALAALWRDAQADGGTVALAIFDVDHFKRFNDRYGHPRGDDCLRKVAETLGAMPIREGDLAARMGGEEFVLLLPGTETEGAIAVAQRALAALRDRMILHEEGVVNEDGPVGIVTASVGVAACRPCPGLDAAALIAAADAALYCAKAAGRNRVVAAHDVAAEAGASQTTVERANH
jgi:diguanylate cyclase (GGDEF)-like protein